MTYKPEWDYDRYLANKKRSRELVNFFEPWERAFYSNLVDPPHFISKEPYAMSITKLSPNTNTYDYARQTEPVIDKGTFGSTFSITANAGNSFAVSRTYGTTRSFTDIDDLMAFLASEAKKFKAAIAKEAVSKK